MIDHQRVARAMIRRLHDPGAALEDLPAEERALLDAVDPRAWRIDGQRRARVLRGLFDEFKGSCTVVVARTRRIASLDDFFSSAHFHGEVAARGSLAAAFARHLAEVGAPAGLLALEGALALCRREIAELPHRLCGDLPEQPWAVRSPGVAAIVVDGAALEQLNAVERWLFQASLMPAMALADDAPALELPPGRPEEPLHLVIRPVDGEPAPVELGRAVQQVLAALEEPRPIAEVAAEFQRLPLAELLADLENEGLVSRG